MTTITTVTTVTTSESSPSDAPTPTVVCPVRLWCCGNLRTAAISVGFTNIISLILLTSYYIGTTLYTESFHLTMLVVALLVMLLVFTNVGLIYGATKRYQWLFLPWMFIYLPAIIALLIFCSVHFYVLEGKQLPAILLVFVSSYFYAIVVAAYIELKLENKKQMKDVDDECDDEPDGASKLLSTKSESTKKTREDCLIDLTELDNLNSTTCVDDNGRTTPPTTSKADETFSALALRTPSTVKNGCVENGLICDAFNSLDDSGEFTMPHVEDATGNSDFNFSSHFTSCNGNSINESDLLPVPEEVIPIRKLVEKIESDKTRKTEQSEKSEKSDQSLNETGSDVTFSTPTAKSSSNLLTLSDPLTGLADPDPLAGLLPAKSDPKITTTRTNLLVNVDFSPFRKSEVRNGSNPPKMKIFLPKNSDSSDDGSASDSSVEVEENCPLKSPAAT